MKVKVAVFPSGTEIGLEINRALRYSKDIELYGLSSIKDHTRCVYKNYIEDLPYYHEKPFIKTLNFYIKKYNIDFIYPAHDDVLLFLTNEQKNIDSKIITSELETVEICRSKKKTYDFFKEEEFIPKVYSEDCIEEFPVFLKPNIGQGSKGAQKINYRDELEASLKEIKDPVICEYLPGEEYTIDCFTDFKGSLKICKQRIRKRIKDGISVDSEVVKLEKEIWNIANVINNKLKINGAWFFQVKKDKKDHYKLLEIAPRIAGTMGLTRNLGINYPLLTIYNHLKIPIEIVENKYEIEVDRALFNRYVTNIYYENVYIDLDDTLILNGKVNTFLIMFLYQCVNNNKKIFLITKHKNKVNNTLSKYKISTEIFEEIIHLKDCENKSDVIQDRASIFIDDSFSERKKVFEKMDIPVFDLDSVECLIDWRDY